MAELEEIEEPDVLIVTRGSDGLIEVEYEDAEAAVYMLTAAVQAIVEQEHEDAEGA